MTRPQIDRIVVVVPAHDEQLLVGSALAALRVAAEAVAPVPVEVIVVANGCRDLTAEVARDAGATVVVLDEANVGAARAAGLDLALSRGDVERLWLATTDADSRVPAHWLTSHLAAHAAGHDAHLGTVELDAHERLRFGAWVDAYAAASLAPGRHGHVHGASIGLTAEAYVRSGGFRPLARSEDVDLVTRLEAAGERIHWEDGAPVRTSSRLAARAPRGVAADLADSLQGGQAER